MSNESSEVAGLPERDIEILKHVNRCRFMRSGQIWKLVFPEKKVIRVPNRRLKRLKDLGYLATREFRKGNGALTESLYFLTPQGATYLHNLGFKVMLYSEERNKNYPWYLHALGISDFYVSLNLANANDSPIQLIRYINEFEIMSNAKKDAGLAKRKIFAKLQDQRGKDYEVLPDALFILQDSETQEKMMFCLEVDRSTETWTVLKNKLIGYNLARKTKFFSKFVKDYQDFVILFQCESERRAKNIHQAFAEMEGEEYVWTCTREDVKTKNLLHDPIFRDWQGERVGVLVE